MKRNLYGLLLLLSGLFPATRLTASHIMGGELTYTWIGGNDYNLQLTLYRDCSGVPAPTAPTIQITAPNCGGSMGSVNLTVSPLSPLDITPVCTASLSTCNGGPLTGVQKWDYSGTVTLAVPCDDYTFTYSDCCRNSTITNLDAASTHGASFTATLDNLHNPFNNSPRFASDPVIFLSQGATHNINNGAYDPDNDSLSISLAPAIDEYGVSIPYTPGFSYTAPVSTSGTISLDPFTGNLMITPVQQEVDVIVYRVEEYRNGQFIGSISRDIQVIVSGNTNQLPSISGINGTGSITGNVCAGDTLRFMLYSADADTADSTFISWVSNQTSNISVTTYGSAQDSALVEFITDSSMIRSMPYDLIIYVRDNACSYYGQQTYSLQLYVNACSADVWPGDANSDLTCNMYDILPIGLGYGDTGPVRSNATLAWVAQPATDWASSFISGVNYKHADCNGDGVIDNQDTTAISQNYGFTHPLRLSHGNQAESVNQLYLVASRDSAGPTDTFQVRAFLGTSMNPVSSIYGIAFRISFNSLLVDSLSSSLSFIPSGLGVPGNNLLTFVRPDWNAGFVDAVAVRTDHLDGFSDSLIAVFDVVIVDNVSARTICNFQVQDIKGVTSDGLIQYFIPSSDSVDISQSTSSVPWNTLAGGIYLFPNPARDEVVVTNSLKLEGTIQILDMTGRIVKNYPMGSLNCTLDVSGLPQGSYIFRLETPKGIAVKNLSIFR